MNKNIKKELEFIFDLWNRNMSTFDSIDDTYEFYQNTDPETEGYGFKFIGKKDKFQPIISIHLFREGGPKGSISIFVNNRNGNDIIMGNTIAIYSMKYEYKENLTEKELKKLDDRYKEMVKYAIEKWSKYDKSNIIGYIENEERKEF